MIIDIWEGTNEIVEKYLVRENINSKLNLNIMYGCNNFVVIVLYLMLEGRENRIRRYYIRN